MTDPRMESLAELLIKHSVSLKPGEHVLIEAFDLPEAMLVATIAAAPRRGASPPFDGGAFGLCLYAAPPAVRLAP